MICGSLVKEGCKVGECRPIFAEEFQ